MSSKRREQPAEDEEASFQPPKLPKTPRERDTAKRLIVVLEQASLESVQVGKRVQLLNSAEHAKVVKANERDTLNLRPDIVHQCLLMLLDSPLNKAGLLQVYLHTQKNALIEVHPQCRIPRIYSRFSGLMVQLLQGLSISAKGSSVKLLKVIKNPITDHLPTGCLKIATSYSSKQLVKLPQYAATVGQDRPVCFVVGAIAHGELNVPWVDETVAVSQYAMSAAGVCAKLTDAFEQTWGIH